MSASRRWVVRALSGALAVAAAGRVGIVPAAIGNDLAVGADLTIRQRVASFLAARGNTSLVPLSTPESIVDVGAVLVAVSCTYCWDFWVRDRAAFAQALTARGVFSAAVPYPRLPADEASLAVLLGAEDFPAAFDRAMTTLARRRPRNADGVRAVCVEAAGRSARAPDERAGTIVGLNRYFGERLIGLKQTPVLVVGNDVWQGTAELQVARKALGA